MAVQVLRYASAVRAVAAAAAQERASAAELAAVPALPHAALVLAWTVLPAAPALALGQLHAA